MYLPMVGRDDEIALEPIGIVKSAGQKFQGELFEHQVVGNVEFGIG